VLCVNEWQKEIADQLVGDHSNVIHVIINNQKNANGCSLLKWMCRHKFGQNVPSLINKANEFMAWCMSFAPSKCYMIDLPHTPRKTEIKLFYTAIENLKNGYMCDMHNNKGREMYFDEPAVIVFTNSVPKSRYLNKHRWKLWSITHDNKLVAFEK